ncbi:hypothetical protein GCM10010320_81260 [Streptomyces caelestis]|nr:hypothetical protein GCM10010320_81260 [Streptomyces caelestis]
MPLLSDELFTVLEQELAKGPVAHGWPDQTWTLSRIKALVGRRFQGDRCWSPRTGRATMTTPVPPVTEPDPSALTCPGDQVGPCALCQHKTHKYVRGDCPLCQWCMAPAMEKWGPGRAVRQHALLSLFFNLSTVIGR